MTSVLDTTELGPRDDVATTEIVLIDIFQEDTTFSVSAEVYAKFPSGVICENTSEYECSVDKNFNVEVEIECVLADGSNTDCNLIPPAEDL